MEGPGDPDGTGEKENPLRGLGEGPRDSELTGEEDPLCGLGEGPGDPNGTVEEDPLRGLWEGHRTRGP